MPISSTSVPNLQDLCLTSYLKFLETECKTWVDLKNSGSKLLEAAAEQIIPTLQRHLASFLSGTCSANLRELMFSQVISGKFPTDRYRNNVEGSYDGDTYQFGLFDSFYRIHDDIVRHSKRCARLCCTGVFIVETMLRVIINDELKQLVLPPDIMDRIWNRKKSPYYEGGIERLVPFNYPALLSRYTESVIFNVPRDKTGLPTRQPALTKLKVGNFDTIIDLKRNGHNWKLMNSYSVSREYLAFLKHLSPQHPVFSSGVSEEEYDWPLRDKAGVLPTHTHASFAFKSLFDLFRPAKSMVNLGQYSSLSEISLNNTQSMMFSDRRGMELFSAIGKAVPALKVLDLSQTLIFSAELLLHLLFQDAFQSLHEFMYLHHYKVVKQTDVERDTSSEIRLHSTDRYCPWCYDEGAYHDNLRSGCSQTLLNINIVDDRVYQFVESLGERIPGFSRLCLLQCVSASSLVRAITAPTKILIRNSEKLPYEVGFLPDPGTEHLGEPDGSGEQKWTWYPPADIIYQDVDAEAFGLQKINPLAGTLQVLRVPPFSRSLWGELVPFIMTACPNLKTLGKPSGLMLGLELLDNMDGECQTNLEEVFIHLDLLKLSDLPETPNPNRLGDGDIISQNSPNLRFVVDNLGPKSFERIRDDDDEREFLKKEFCLEVWDHAVTLLPQTDLERRLDKYIDNICRIAPKTRSLHILSLSHIENSNIQTNTELWDKLLSLKFFSELLLQMNHLIYWTGLIKSVGPHLKKLKVSEMIGDRDQPLFSSEYEGLDLDEQGALFVCENCPNLEELDLVSINFIRKFFFGRQIVTSEGHFKQLRKLSVGKIDWNSFLQVWRLLYQIEDIEIAVIVPHFSLNQQFFEEAKVLTIFDIQDLFKTNQRIKNSLEKILVNTFRFATFEAAMYFVQDFKCLKSVGSIDIENFNQDDKAKMKEFVVRMERENVNISLADVFEAIY